MEYIDSTNLWNILIIQIFGRPGGYRGIDLLDSLISGMFTNYFYHCDRILTRDMMEKWLIDIDNHRLWEI